MANDIPDGIPDGLEKVGLGEVEYSLGLSPRAPKRKRPRSTRIVDSQYRAALNELEERAAEVSRAFKRFEKARQRAKRLKAELFRLTKGEN
jgi:hypothetical protein